MTNSAADDDVFLVRTTNAAQRLAMMGRLAQDAWTFSGRDLPQYTRAEMPVRLITPDDEVE